MVNEQFRLQIVRKLACQLLTALIYIKHMGVIHGDLKLENVLFVTGNFKYNLIRKNFQYSKILISISL